DFPKLWNDAKTPDRERKGMAPLLLEDVTLRREEEVLVQVRFKGGATRELRLPLPQRAWEMTQTNPQIVAAIDRLLEDYTGKEVAQLLNQRQWRSGHGLDLNQRMVHRLAKDRHLASRDERLRARGLLTPQEIAELIESNPTVVGFWGANGRLKGPRRNEKNEYYYERPSPEIVQQIKQR